MISSMQNTIRSLSRQPSPLGGGWLRLHRSRHGPAEPSQQSTTPPPNPNQRGPTMLHIASTIAPLTPVSPLRRGGRTVYCLPHESVPEAIRRFRHETGHRGTVIVVL